MQQRHNEFWHWSSGKACKYTGCCLILNLQVALLLITIIGGCFLCCFSYWYVYKCSSVLIQTFRRSFKDQFESSLVFVCQFTMYLVATKLLRRGKLLKNIQTMLIFFIVGFEIQEHFCANIFIILLSQKDTNIFCIPRLWICW